MNNLEVLKKFINREKGATPKRNIINGYFSYEGRTLSTDGKKLINYSTTICEWVAPNKVKLNCTKYSQTTSKIQNKLRELLNNNNIIIDTYIITD